MKQFAAYHGPVLKQAQQIHYDTEGKHIPLDKLKRKHKLAFLDPVPQYFSDGTPVMEVYTHPRDPTVKIEKQREDIPSLGDLSLEDLNAFINDVIEYYLHNYGIMIIIDPTKSTR